MRKSRRGGIVSLILAVAMGSFGCFPAAAAEPRASQNASAEGFILLKIQVSDLKRSLDFYTHLVGMKEAQRVDPPGPVEEVLLNFNGRKNTFALVLVYNSEKQGPIKTAGSGFPGPVIAVPDIGAAIARIANGGYKIARPPTRVNDQGLNITYAFAQDPDGYPVELVQFHGCVP